MGRIGMVAVLSVLAACAAGEARTEVAGPPALDLSEKGLTSGDGTDNAFARSVAARYADAVPVADVMQDLTAHGFSCDESGAYCTRAVMDGPCADAWTVDFSDGGAAHGTLVRRCMGALADEQ